MKAPGSGNAFQKRTATFMGTVMGTMVFIAKTKSIPLGAKIAAAVILVGGGIAATIVLLQMRSQEQSRAALEAALALPAGEGTARVRELAGAGLDEPSMLRAVSFLGEQRDAQSVPVLVDALDSTLALQRAAAGALAEIGPPGAQPAVDALALLLEDEDEVLRGRAAWALARLSDARGIDKMIEALAAGSAPSLPSYEPRTLAQLMDREGLLDALGHDSATVRQFAAYHLGEVCRPTDEPALSRAAQDTDVSVSNAAIVTAARCGASSSAALISAAFAGGHARWNALYTQLRDEVGAPGLGPLLPYAPDPTAHRALVQEIGASSDPRAGVVLLTEIARLPSPSPRDRLDAAAALAASSDPRVLEVLEPLLASEDAEHVRAAIAMLGRAGLPSELSPRLLAIVRADAAQRAAAIDALGELGACSDEVQRALERHLPQRPLRTNALRTLGRCGNPRAEELARREVSVPLAAPITVEVGALRLAALDVVASRGLLDLAPMLFEQATDVTTDSRVRAAIADVLGVIAPDPLRDRALDRLLDPQQPRPVRAAMMRMLRRGIAPSSAPRLLGFVRGGEDDERTRDAAVLLGLAHHGESRAELVQLLSDERARATAALALALGGDATSAAPLAALVRSDDAVATRLARDLREPPWSFALGREAAILSDVSSAMAARDAGFALPASRLCAALDAPTEGLRAPSAYDVRRSLVGALAEGPDAAQRALAAQALTCIGARSAVLYVRDRGGHGAAEARGALSAVRASTPAP